MKREAPGAVVSPTSGAREKVARRADDSINLIAAIEANEEEAAEKMNQRVFSGRVFSGAEIKTARYAEFDRLEEFDAKEDVLSTDVDGPLLSVTWVD